MIHQIETANLSMIKNRQFRQYAQIYCDIYQDFIENIKAYGLPLGEDERTYQQKQLQRLLELGAVFSNDRKSIAYGTLSPACQACRKGNRSVTLYFSLACHRHCYYCFNPNQEQYETFSKQSKNAVEELCHFHKKRRMLDCIALSGGEPLLDKEKTIEYFQIARKLYPKAHLRLYTSGDLLEEKTVIALASAGLDEIRFSIKLEDNEQMRACVYRAIALAKRYISSVYVEMPVIPGTEVEMQELLKRLEELAVDGINLLEFCFPFHHEREFKLRSFQLKNPVQRVLYEYWYAGGLAVAGSELACLSLLLFAMEQKLNVRVQYCSLENKHTAQIYEQNHPYCQDKFLYFSPRDFFLKTAKVFGEDIDKVIEIFHEENMRQYKLQEDYLEFPVVKIDLLQKFDLEIGIAYYVVEIRENAACLRELKVDLLYAKDFLLTLF